MRLRFGVAALAAGLLLPACDDSGSGGPPGPMPDFQLQDVNPQSVSYNTAVSPRNYLTYVSAWFFGWAT